MNDKNAKRDAQRKKYSVTERIKRYGNSAFPEGDQQPAGDDADKPTKSSAKKYAKGGKVRGAGIAKKGVRKAKMC